MSDLDRLGAAIAFVNAKFPLPRCEHGHALRDDAGDTLEPSCGCERCPAGIRGIIVADCDFVRGHEGSHQCRSDAGGMNTWAIEDVS